LVEFIVPASVEVLCEKCFHLCGSLSSVTFESQSRLSQIGNWAFSGTGLVEMIVPASVEVLGEMCFSECGSLSSVIFEPESRLLGIQTEVLQKAGWVGRAE
jgi:hypothetical protein